MRITIAISCIPALLLLLPAAARADRRAYGQTYEAVTAPQGELDVELWHTFAQDAEVPEGPGTAAGHRSMVELEYGLTDRWDVALYGMFDELTADPGWAGLKIETRYRLSLPGEWPVDPVLYLEYQHRARGDATDSLEGKVIVAKDLGPWNVALNASAEEERLTAGAWNLEGEYALGVSRELGTPAWKLGLEAFGKMEKPEQELETYAWAGPALSWGDTFGGALHGLWVTVAAGRGLTRASPALYARAIVGLQF